MTQVEIENPVRKTRRQKQEDKPRSAGKFDKALGTRIRMFRMQAKISQADLGGKLGVSFQQVQKYEKGVNRLSMARLLQIAKALKVSVTDLYQDVESSRSGAVEAFLATREGNQLMRAAMKIESPELRWQLVEVAKTFAGVSGGGDDSA